MTIKELCCSKVSALRLIPILCILIQKGLNTIRSPFCVDQKTKEVRKQDIIFEVYADSKAPVTKISFSSGKTFKKDNKLFVKGTSQILLTASDELSGVDKNHVFIGWRRV